MQKKQSIAFHIELILHSFLKISLFLAGDKDYQGIVNIHGNSITNLRVDH